MGRHAFAEGLLQFLGFLAWVAGLAGLIAAAMLWSQDGQGLAATQLAIATVVGAAGLLAVTHVGLAVIDLAQTAAEGLRRLEAIETGLARAPEPARTVPAPLPRAVTTAPAPPAIFDERRWGYLKEVDAEVAGAAARAAALGPRWETALAERVLALGTSYLPAIERSIGAQADDEAQAATTAQAAVGHLSEAARHELLSYRASVEARNGVDPHTLKRVVSIEPYDGTWQYLIGGVKVALADGTWLLAKGSMRRTFDRDPDLAP